MAKSFVDPGSQAILTLLAGTVIGVVVIGGLYWAQAVLMPVALAVFLASLLAPLVTALQRRHLGRIPAIVLVVLFATLVLGGVVWMVKVELTSLTDELPTYTENIQGKVKYLRQMGHDVGTERLGKFAQDITGEWEKTLPNAEGEPTEPPTTTLPAVPKKSSTVTAPPESPAPAPVVQPETPTWMSWLLAFFSPVMSSLGSLVLAIVLVVFMLFEREALRNRLIRLVGNGRVTTTTKALDDAGKRISRYLLMQLIVNGSYGVTWGLGLYLIGVDYAILWGFLAAVLRYVPYIGAPVAAMFPIALSLAQFPGWWQPITVIAFLLILELLSNNAVEPLLYGQSIGVSAVAMLIAAAFWTFLWGPIGLVLSGPLTICLVVLGKHVPKLGFVAVLLSDAPALDTDVSYYQRLLARDQDEAAQLVLSQAKASSPEQVYDELLVPALVYTKRDLERDLLTEADEQFVLQATHEVLEDLGERRSAATMAAAKELPAVEVPARASRVRILACPARDRADKLALEMLRQLLNPAEWDVEVTAVETLTAELVAHVTEEKSALICIGALPPGGLAHTRYLCKRLRARHPDLKIIVGRWGLKDNVDANREQLQEVGADMMAATLLETRKQLNDWLPALAYEEAKTAAS
ncbi:MAG: AI-2E family transporter [Candidatus Hydrogenedentes bacterium]|nr:AI-2E family transporter [Candidatus Hydrogenedentota bacterium]